MTTKDGLWALNALRAAAARAVKEAGVAHDAGDVGGEKAESNSGSSGEPAGDVGTGEVLTMPGGIRYVGKLRKGLPDYHCI